MGNFCKLQSFSQGLLGEGRFIHGHIVHRSFSYSESESYLKILIGRLRKKGAYEEG